MPPPSPCSSSRPIRRRTRARSSACLDDARGALAERHRRASSRPARTEAGGPARAARRYPIRRTAPTARRASCSRGGLVVLGAGSIPLATTARPGARSWRRRRPTRPAPSRTSATPRTSIAIARRRRGARATCRPTSPPTTRCPAGCAEVAGVPVRDLRARRRLAMDVDSPLDLLLLEGVRGGTGRCRCPTTPTRGRSATRLAGPARARRRPGRGAARRRADVRRRTCAGSSARHAVADAGARRGARPAHGRARARPRAARTARPPRSRPRRAPRPRRARGASGDIVAALCRRRAPRLARAARPPPRRRRARAGRPPRTASRATSCCPSASATRGSRSLTAAGARRTGPGAARRPHARRARASRLALGAAWRRRGGMTVEPGLPATAPSRCRTRSPSARTTSSSGASARRSRRDGPITFARFMERALYEPGHGYYRRAEAGPGTAGADFLTAPEAHPIFGAAIGRLLEQAWDALGRPSPFTVTEPGAGTGALAAGPPRRAPRPRARPCSTPSATARSRWSRRGSRRSGSAWRPRAWPAAPRADAGRRRTGARRRAGAVVANEVLDALPVHRVVGPGRAACASSCVGRRRRGRLRAGSRPSPRTPALADRLAGGGRRPRRRPGHRGLPRARRLARRRPRATSPAGVVVLVDYAAEPADLHGAVAPRRHAPGLRPPRGGRRSVPPRRPPGSHRHRGPRRRPCGRRAAPAWSPIGETTQAELLARAGTADLDRCLPAPARRHAPGRARASGRRSPGSSTRAAWAASASSSSVAACRAGAHAPRARARGRVPAR